VNQNTIDYELESGSKESVMKEILSINSAWSAIEAYNRIIY